MALWDEQGSILMENGLLLWAHMSAAELTKELRSAALRSAELRSAEMRPAELCSAEPRHSDDLTPETLERIERVLCADAFDRVVPLPAMPVVGGRLAPVCSFHGDRLHSVTLCVAAVGTKAATAEQQRAFLFACARVEDPAPDTRKCVSLYCGFGSAVISTDPRTGLAALRLTYR